MKKNAKLKCSYKEKGPDIEVDMKIDLTRIEEQFAKAQYGLDTQVMQDMIPYMPKQTGNFIDVTVGMSHAIAGTGQVVAAAPPIGRFLYKGKTMVDEKTGSPWARKGAKKVLATEHPMSQARPTLEFNKTVNQNAQAHWFEAAKKDHGEEWVAKVKKEAGGG